MRPWIPLPVFLFCVLCLCSPAAAQLPEIPSAWSGIWEMSVTERDCGSEVILDSWTESDTLCAGDAFAFEEVPGGLSPECIGSVDDTALDFSCTASQEVFTGCTATITVTLQATRTGETMAGDVTFDVVYTGLCPLPDQCTVQDYTGTRVAAAPAECAQVPAVTASWGAWKSRY